MRLVFVGSSKFSLRCLSACMEIPNLSVVGALTTQRKLTISYSPTGVENVLYADVGELASAHGVPVLTMERGMNELGLFESVVDWKPDIFLVAGWYHMIPKKWRELAPAYGLHASLLPDYSGGAPLVWAMINGESKTGITFFRMDDKVDSGPIIGQKEESINSDDTIATLYERIEERGLELLREGLLKLVNGEVQFRDQDESKRRVMPQRSPDDGLINWATDAAWINRFIRAQTKPYPGAFTILDGKPLHIWSVTVGGANEQSKVGYLMRQNDGNYCVGCKKGIININEVSYGERTYNQSQLTELFGEGGQRLGEF